MPKRLKPPKRTRSCIVCGKRFTPKRKDALYCGNACKQKAFRWRREEQEVDDG
jgi:hypothetical protein